MSGRQFVWAVAGFAAVMSLSAGQAQAGKMMFGTDETIHTIQPTRDPQYELCYKTSIFFAIAGCYVTDDGYVIRKIGEPGKYIPLTPALIQQLQQEGELPTPLPKYSLSVFDYVFGYSNWIILAFIFGIPSAKWAWRKARPAPADVPPPTKPSAELGAAPDRGPE